MDFRKRHARQPDFRRNLMADSAQTAALLPNTALLFSSRAGWKSFHRHRLLFLFGRREFWRLGSRNLRLSAVLDVARGSGRAWRDFVLCVNAHRARSAAAISRA